MDTEVDYSGILRRIIAYIIDAILFNATIFTLSCFLLVFPAFTTHNLYDYLFSKTVAQDISDAVAVIYVIIVYIAFSILMIVKFSGTPGQLLLGMRVKDKNTLENITVMQAIKRALSFKILDSTASLCQYHISAWFLILLILIWIFILLLAVHDECKQALHDKIANTVVINYSTEVNIFPLL